MGKKAHIGEVVVSTSKGNVHISVTPYASKNPFGWIEGDFDNAKITHVRIVEN